MDVLWGFILVIAMVAIHEAGHAAAARALGVGVLKFSIGFGPGIVIWRTKNFPIVFSPILLGGYVAIKSNRAAKEVNKLTAKKDDKKLNPRQEQLLAVKVNAWKEAAEKNAAAGGRYFEDVSYWRRMTILSAGIISNLLSAIIIMTILLIFAGGQEVGLFGHRFSLADYSESWYLAPVMAAANSLKLFLAVFTRLILAIPTIFINLYQTLALHSPQPHSGMIGTFRISAEAAAAGWPSYLLLVYLLSIIMAAFNILPLGILDGGQMFIMTVEKIFGGSKAAEIAKTMVNIFGLLLLAAFMLLMVGSDILDVYNWLK